MNNPEVPPSLSIYRPVSNVHTEMLEQIKEMAVDYGVNLAHIGSNLQLAILTPKELRAYYAAAPDPVVATADDMQELKEFCEDSQFESARHGRDVATWPPNMYEDKIFIGDKNQFQFRNTVTLGQKQPQFIEEYYDFRDRISVFGTINGPLEHTWKCTGHPGEIFLASKRRRAREKSQISRFVKALRGANILPHTLELSPVVIDLE